MSSALTDREALVGLIAAVVKYKEDLTEQCTVLKKAFDAYAAFTGEDQVSKQKLNELEKCMLKFTLAYAKCEKIHEYLYQLLVAYDTV